VIAASIISPDFARYTDIESRVKFLNQLRSKPFTLREQHWLDLTTGILPINLELLDRTAAAFGVEARHPFFDKRLVEFCLALPPNQKLRRGWSRWILHQAMVSILHDLIRLRNNKTNAGPNFVYGLLTFERQTLDKILLADTGNIERFANLKTVQQAYQQLVSQPEPRVKDVMAVWTVVTLALWLRYSGLSPVVARG
jgi:asparagine synthase (glutamine-hydrolysing)